jgi:acyl-coenzyme A synthetase/AMP-(fatty) acid ligase
VEIPHQALVNFLLSMKERPGLTAQDVLVAVTTISFDIAGLEIFLPLVTGARVVLLSRDDAADGFRVLHHLTAHHATVLQATPSTWRMLLEAKWPGNPQLKMLCGGEAMPRDLADQLLAKGGELWNMYGPTETTIWSSVAQVTRDDAPINIGRPIANTRLYILDPHLQPVPVGVPGELHIGGMGLARGYHNRPELTAEKFIADPFQAEPGARLYKTGDSARFLPDGGVDCLGRLDHQVKIRGFRVELGEIEEVLNRHPAVQTSAVVVREDTPGNKRLTAYVVNRNGAASSSELRECLRGRLPDYMVPAAFVTLEALPLTPNGKLDRKALPVPGFERPELSASYVAPGNPTEKILADIWAQSLALEKVGIHDNFFELGGHSLLLVQVQSRVCEKLQTQVSIVEMFQYPTISSLARHLSQPSAESDRLQKVPERTRRRKEALSRQREMKGK